MNDVSSKVNVNVDSSCDPLCSSIRLICRSGW